MEPAHALRYGGVEVSETADRVRLSAFLRDWELGTE